MKAIEALESWLTVYKQDIPRKSGAAAHMVMVCLPEIIDVLTACEYSSPMLANMDYVDASTTEGFLKELKQSLDKLEAKLGGGDAGYLRDYSNASYEEYIEALELAKATFEQIISERNALRKVYKAAKNFDWNDKLGGFDGFDAGVDVALQKAIADYKAEFESES